MRAGRRWIAVFLCLWPILIRAQERPLFTTDFPPEEFAERRRQVFERIGPEAIALLQGAPAPIGWVRFRQSNEFYYLCGVEVPNAYLLLDGRTQRTFLYLPHRNEQRERSEGKVLSAEDADLVKRLTGVDAVYGTEALAGHLARYVSGFGAVRPPVLYTPFSPAEGVSTSRSAALPPYADNLSNPWDGSPSREGWFVHLLRLRFPQFEIRDLSPILDELRVIKSPREIRLIRRATELAGLAIMEAMRSTEPGVMEYELDALAKFIFYRNGAQAEAYRSIIAGGRNAYMNHYFANADELRDGDLVLMDFCPDVGYYVCDVTRQFPVNGRFNPWQRELYGFYLACYKTLLARIRPGVTPQAIMQEVAQEWERILAQTKFSKSIYEQAARRFVAQYKNAANNPRASLGHWVGMAVHDAGPYRGEPLRPGMVLTVEPEFRVPEEQIFIRLEDMILITEQGAEVLSGFIPMEIEDIERVMREEGILQKYPRAFRRSSGSS